MDSANRQTFFGIDFGTKRIGVAVGQNITGIARPLTTINVIQQQPDWQHLQTLIDEWRPNAFVVGIPYNMDGSPQNTTLMAKKFCEQCKAQFTLPVHQVDERLSTVEARSQIFSQGGYKALKKSEIDAYAAKLILESWLQQQNSI